MGAPDVVACLAAAQEPWSVNTMAQAMGVACLAGVQFGSADKLGAQAQVLRLAAGGFVAQAHHRPVDVHFADEGSTVQLLQAGAGRGLREGE